MEECFFYSCLGILGYDIHVDENAEVEFNVTIMEKRGKDGELSINMFSFASSNLPSLVIFTC